MKQTILIILMTVILQVSGIAQTGKVKATASIDSTKILIGDQVLLHLEVDQPKNTKVKFPEIGDSITSAIQVVKRSPLDTFTLSDAEQIKIIQNLTVTSFDTGVQMIPQLRFLLENNDLSDSVFTQPIAVKVMGMAIDTTKGPVDIKSPYGAPVTLKEVTPYILGIILIAALIFFFFYYLQRKKKNQPLFSRPEKPKEPAHVIALRKLDHIKDEKIWQQDKIKQYYSEVSDTLREYIVNRFEISAMEQTSAEILGEFKFRRDLIDEKSLEELARILELSDLVKFAKYHPLPDDNNLALINSYFFVNQTKKDEIKKPEQPVDDREGEEVEVKL